MHGMPQIGQLRKGLWVASGFGRQGLNTSAMAGQLIARSILWGDERWRLFSPFELVWAGGATGRVAGHLIGLWRRGSSAAAGALARYREGAARPGTRARGAAGRGQPAGRNQAAAAARSAAGPAARCRPQPPRAGRRRRTAGSADRPRRKVRKSGTVPCNVGGRRAVFDGEPFVAPRTEIS